MTGGSRISLIAAAVTAACASTPASQPTNPPAPRAAPLAPGLAPVEPSFDPCVDFEVYACGPRFGEQAILRRPGDLRATGARDYRRFVEEVLEGKHIGQFVGGHDVRTYLMGCLVPTWRNAGIADLRQELDAVSAAANLGDLARRLGHLRAIGLQFLIDFDLVVQPIDGRPIVAASLSLADSFIPAPFHQPPHRTALLNREHWRRLATLSHLANRDDADAAARVDSWLALMHPWDVDAIRPLRLLAPGALERRSFPWRDYFEGLGHNIAGPFVVVEPEEIARIDALATLPLAALKSYVRVLFVEGAARLLTQELIDEEYRFHFLAEDTVMHGSWSPGRACPSTMPGYLRADLRRAFLLPLREHHSEDWARSLLGAVRDRLVSRVQRETAADARVRNDTARALARLEPMFVKDTSPLAPDSGSDPPSSLLRFYFDVGQAAVANDLAQLGKAWDGDTSSSSQDAAVFPTMGRMWLSPEVLGPPYLTAPPWGPATYGGLGFLIGHELGHLVPRALWPGAAEPAASWNGHSASLRADWLSCMGQLFDKVTFSAKIQYDLRSSLDEYMADVIGIRTAFDVMQTSAPAADAAGEQQRQRTFFVAYAQNLCAMEDDDRSTVAASVDSHPSVLLRINGVVSQSAAFARAFGCQPGQPMAPAQRCTPW